MWTVGRKAAVAAVAISLAVSACGSSKSGSSSGASGSGNAKTVTVGVLVDETGLAASGNKTAVQGVQAGVLWAKDQGYTLHTVLADTTSTPAGALTAAQKLVTQDHVVAVIVNSALTFGAADYLKQHNVPVVGLAEDGPEWQTDLNMFSMGGAIHTNVVPETYGKFFKAQGVTTIGTVGYGISPSSSEYAKAVAESSKRAGLKIGYVNGNFPFGSTNVTPVALAMKSANVDGVYAPIDPNTAFALVAALRQVGASVKVALFATGYGADLTQGGPNATSVAQGLYFSIGEEPVEMHTAPTQLFEKYLKQAGVTGEPTEAMYNGYTAVGLLVRGIKDAGSSVTSASLITALSNVHSWDDMGLWGGRTLDINDRKNIGSGPDNCTWIVQYSGQSFHLVAGADPVCGAAIPGVTVSAG